VLFDLLAIAAELLFWHRLLVAMFDTAAWYWSGLWGVFAALDAARPSSQAVKSAASRRHFSMVAGLFSSHTRRCLNAWSCSPVMV